MLKLYGIEVVNHEYKQFIIRGRQEYKARDYRVESDFSQANYLDKLTKLLETSLKTADRLQHTYYRAPNGSPFQYSKLAGDN